MAEEDTARQDGMVRATAGLQMRLSFYLPECACLLSSDWPPKRYRFDTSELENKAAQEEGKGKRNKSRGGG